MNIILNFKFIVGLCALTAFLMALYVVFAGFNLRIKKQNNIPEVDVLFTFATSSARINYSRDKIKTTNSDWIISDPNSDILKKGVIQASDLDIAHTITDVHSTYDEIISLNKYLSSHYIDSPTRIGLVSSRYHMRRIKLLSKRYLKRSNYELYYFPVPEEYYPHPITDKHFDAWWKYKILIKESIKNLVYKLYIYKLNTAH